MGILDKALEYNQARKSPLEMLRDIQRQNAADKMATERFQLEQQMNQQKMKEVQQDIIAKQAANQKRAQIQQIMTSARNADGSLDYKKAGGLLYASGYSDEAKMLLEGEQTMATTRGTIAKAVGQENVNPKLADNMQAETDARTAQAGLYKQQGTLTHQQAIGEGYNNLTLDEMNRAKIDALKASAEKDRTPTTTPYKPPSAASPEQVQEIRGKIRSMDAYDLNKYLPRGTTIENLFDTLGPDQNPEQAFEGYVAAVVNRAKQYELTMGWDAAVQKALVEETAKLQTNSHGSLTNPSLADQTPVRTIDLTDVLK